MMGTVGGCCSPTGGHLEIEINAEAPARPALKLQSISNRARLSSEPGVRHDPFDAA